MLLVVDSMIGREAAELTRSFHEQVGITGAVLTKMDGDPRVTRPRNPQVSGAPIVLGTGEKVSAPAVPPRADGEPHPRHG